MIAKTHEKFEMPTEGRRLVVSAEDDCLLSAVRFVGGGFFLALGLMVLRLLIGGGPLLKPDATFAQSAVAIGFVGLGVVSLCLGLGVLFFRDRFVFDTENGRIESHMTIFGKTIRRQDFDLKGFDSVVAERKRLGAGLTGHTMLAVECRPAGKALVRVNCRTPGQAGELASRIAQHTGLSYCNRIDA